MPMNGNQLGTEIQAQVDGLSDSDKLNRSAIWQAVGRAIVSHIETNATVEPSALIAPGGLSPAPVTGTGTVE